MSRMKIAEGFIIQNTNPRNRPNDNFLYATIWFDKDTKQPLIEYSGSTSADFSNPYIFRLPDGSVVDSYVDAQGISVEWTYHWGGSMYPVMGPKNTRCQLEIGVGEPFAGSAGILRVWVKGEVGKLYIKIDSGQYNFVTLNPDRNEYKYYDITGLAAETYQVEAKDSATPPCTVSKSGTVTIGANEPCLLEITDAGSKPPKAGEISGGTVFGTLIGTQGRRVFIELRQGSTVLAKLELIDSQLAPSYRFEFTGVEPGIYNLYAAIYSTCFFLLKKDITVHIPPQRIGDQMTFLPWVKQKLVLAATVSNTSARTAIKLKVTATSAGNSPDQIEKQLELYGPGDVMGINQSALLGTMPNPNETQFSPLQLASIEFKDEDLPWRYSTPIETLNETSNEERILPWCFLLVLKESEYNFSSKGAGPLPVLNINLGRELTKTALFPDATMHRLSAHVQVNKKIEATDIDTFLNQELKQKPGLAFSRLFSSRRLEPTTKYRAFLIPALEAGRLAGLGITSELAITSITSVLDNKPKETPIDFPVYYNWEFTTGESADIETLLRELHPVSIDDSALKNIAVTVPSTSTVHTFAMPGVVVSANTLPGVPPPDEVTQYLYNELNPGLKVTLPNSSSIRPTVTPPLYGGAYMDNPVLQSGTALPLDWKHQVNLDPRYRVIASLGAQIVQEKQEEYVSRAWEQVQDILLANQKLRGAQYGLRTTAGMRNQHLPVSGTALGLQEAMIAAVSIASSGNIAVDSEDAPPDSQQRSAPAQSGLANYGLQLAGLALSRIRPQNAPLTIRETIRKSAMPLAVFSPTFRRITKPFGRFQAGQVGPPRRLTQENPKTGDPNNPNWELGTGTTLAQRDKLLTLIQEGKLIPAESHPALLRAYQFDDALMDQLLTKPEIPNLRLLDLEKGAYVDTSNLQENFSNAFDNFKDITDETVLQFKTEPFQLPPLQLEQVKAGVIAGTKPDKIFLTRIKQALGGFTPPNLVGDFDANDFDANDFFTGVADGAAPMVELKVSKQEDNGHSQFNRVIEDFTDAPVINNTTAAASDIVESEKRTMGVSKSGTLRADQVTAELPVIPELMAYPVFKDAMGELLRQRHPELFLPGIGNFPPNGIAVLHINHAFIEAFLLGANHALGSELLWRQFPTDLRGSYFRQFWDVSEQINMLTEDSMTPAQHQELETAHLDVQPLNHWSTALGSNSTPIAKPKLLLAIRSEVIRRYPNLVICAQPAGGPDGGPNPNGVILYPKQQLPVGQDILTVSFDLDEDEATGKGNVGPGYFLIFMERPGQPQFGLDENAPVVTPNNPIPAPATWNDLSWQYMGTSPGANLTIDPVGKPHVTADPIPYVTDSAQLAYALFQEPFRAAIHISTLLPTTD